LSPSVKDGGYFGARQPAFSASEELQNHFSPLATSIFVLSYQRLPGTWYILPDLLMLPLILHPDAADVLFEVAGPDCSRMPRRQSHGFTNSPRHIPSLPARATSSPSFCVEWFWTCVAKALVCPALLSFKSRFTPRNLNVSVEQTDFDF